MGLFQADTNISLKAYRSVVKTFCDQFEFENSVFEMYLPWCATACNPWEEGFLAFSALRRRNPTFPQLVSYDFASIGARNSATAV